MDVCMYLCMCMYVYVYVCMYECMYVGAQSEGAVLKREITRVLFARCKLVRYKMEGERTKTSMKVQRIRSAKGINALSTL